MVGDEGGYRDRVSSVLLSQAFLVSQILLLSKANKEVMEKAVRSTPAQVSGSWDQRRRHPEGDRNRPRREAEEKLPRKCWLERRPHREGGG